MFSASPSVEKSLDAANTSVRATFLAFIALLVLPLATPAQDLQGIWQAKAGSDLNLEKFTDPPGSKIPYRPDALAKRQQNFENRDKADTVKRCFLPGVPRITLLQMPFQIFQSGKTVAMVYQYAHAFRSISTDGAPHLDGIDFWMGDSRGHWEGSTLVVDVSDFNDQTWLDAAGDYHSDALHVVERYTRTGPKTITYEATIEDPKVFTHPWKIRVPLELDTQKNARLMEYECQ
jgi:hypothetical protein